MDKDANDPSGAFSDRDGAGDRLIAAIPHRPTWLQRFYQSFRNSVRKFLEWVLNSTWLGAVETNQIKLRMWHKSHVEKKIARIYRNPGDIERMSREARLTELYREWLEEIRHMRYDTIRRREVFLRVSDQRERSLMERITLGCIVFCTTDQVAARNHSFLATAKTRYLRTQSMISSVEELREYGLRLVQVHRQWWVNMEYVKTIIPGEFLILDPALMSIEGFDNIVPIGGSFWHSIEEVFMGTPLPPTILKKGPCKGPELHG